MSPLFSKKGCEVLQGGERLVKLILQSCANPQPAAQRASFYQSKSGISYCR